VLVDRGDATPVDGGWRLSGFWPFGSGIDHAGWVILGGHFPTPDGDGQVSGMFVLPASDVSALDDWHANGLRATGSSSIVVDEVFVPEHRFVAGEVLASLDGGGRKGAPPRKAVGAPRKHALEGVEVLDFGNFLAGPFGPMRPRSGPAGTSQDTPSRARIPPKLIDTPSRVRAAVMAGAAVLGGSGRSAR